MPMTLGMMAQGGKQPSIVFADEQRSGINQTTYTFTCNFGAADTSRFLVIEAMVAGGGVVSVTVDGASPTQIASRASDSGGVNMKVFTIAKPSGTSGTIVITGNSSPLGAAVAVHAVYGCNITAKASGTKAGGANANTFPAINLGSTDVAFFTDYGGNSSVAWTNATQTVDSYSNGVSNYYGVATKQGFSGSLVVSTNKTDSAWPQYFVWGK